MCGCYTQAAPNGAVSGPSLLTSLPSVKVIFPPVIFITRIIFSGLGAIGRD